MPVDSIITTTMISDMVRIIMMSKRGMPKWKRQHDVEPGGLVHFLERS